MKSCVNCGCYPFCIKIPDNKEACTEWVKQPYSKLIKVDGDIKIIERVN